MTWYLYILWNNQHNRPLFSLGLGVLRSPLLAPLNMQNSTVNYGRRAGHHIPTSSIFYVFEHTWYKSRIWDFFQDNSYVKYFCLDGCELGETPALTWVLSPRTGSSCLVQVALDLRGQWHGVGGCREQQPRGWPCLLFQEDSDTYHQSFGVSGRVSAWKLYAPPARGLWCTIP